jgi:hypothetical protein
MRAVICFELSQSAFPAIGDPAQAARLADNFDPNTLRDPHPWWGSAACSGAKPLSQWRATGDNRSDSQ